MNPRTRVIFSVALLGGLTFSAAAAVEPTASVFMDSSLTPTGARLVSTVAQGQVDAAFADAAAMPYSRDTTLAQRLDQVHADAAAAASPLGRPLGPVDLLPIPPTIFPGCEYREYRASYVGGTQYWRLKFRRAADGWKLADLNLRTELKKPR